MTLSATVTWSGAMRSGRTEVTANRKPTQATSVVAIAGRVRRMSTPAVTPTANAKAA